MILLETERTGMESLLISGNRASRMQRGFTLIEIMIVVVLIGIMTAMIIPEMKGTFQDAVLRSTARNIVEVLNLANSQAVSLNQVHKVFFDSRSHRYSIERAAHGRDGIDQAQPEVIGGSGEINGSLSIELQKIDVDTEEREEDPGESFKQDEAFQDRRRDVVAFYPNGTADATEIVLKDRDGFRLLLRINPINARVQIMSQEQK